jgi:outer membrane lipoprotein SlyB
MKSSFKFSALIVVATSILGGCASYSQQPMSSAYPASSAYPTSSYQNNVATYGVIEAIDGMRSAPGTSGAGAIVGGLVGGLLGNQVGGGNGKTAATVVGALGGAYVGNNVEQNRNAPAPDRFQIRIRLDNGDSTSVVQDSVYELRIGDRVRVADGRAYRY